MRLQSQCRQLVWVLSALPAFASVISDAGAAPGDAPTLPKPAQEIPLYPGVAPGSEAWNWSERSVSTANGLPMVQNVVRPALMYYPAQNARPDSPVMVVAPGGGFRTLMMSYEGVDIARRLNAMGIHAFVLKYRLVYNGPDGAGRPQAQPMPTAAPVGSGIDPLNPAASFRRDVPGLGFGSIGAQAGQDVSRMACDDGRRALGLLRERAAPFRLRRDRIGIIGFSAGGMVAMSTLYGPAETRPDFAAVIYGAAPGEVPAKGPPRFLAVSADDRTFLQRTLDLFKAWNSAGLTAELHVFQTGAHGFVKKGGGADHFMDRVQEWLNANKLLPSG